MTTVTSERNCVYTSRSSINASLRSEGYCLLSRVCVDLDDFSVLVDSLCRTVSYDPAREKTGKPHQLVNAGLDEIGLHIENGNTPRPPQLVVFFCEQSASCGSETTVCDGRAFFKALNFRWRERLSKPMTVTRTVPAALWVDYLARELDLNLEAKHIDEETFGALSRQFPNVSAKLMSNGDLLATIQFDPIRRAACSDELGFANALLGPSVNYETPVFRFSNGDEFTEDHRHELTELAEQHTSEIAWRNGDVVVIDNWRVMHGRRAIVDQNRTLHIAMGTQR